MRGFFSSLAVLAGLADIALAQLDPIVIKGSKFFYKTNGTQFFIRGIGYQRKCQQSVQRRRSCLKY